MERWVLVLGWLLENKTGKREEKGLQSISLLPACVSRKNVSIFSSHKIHPRKSFSCGFVSAFEKEQWGRSTLQCELRKGIYHVSLSFSYCTCTYTLTDHFLFLFLIRFPIYTLTVHFFHISAVLAVRQCLVGKGTLTACPTIALQKVCGIWIVVATTWSRWARGCICPFLPPVTALAVSLKVLSKSQF